MAHRGLPAWGGAVVSAVRRADTCDMRLTEPRIAPVQAADWSEEQRALMQPLVDRKTEYNVFKTLVTAPDAFRGFMAYGSYILSRANSLPAREREIVILRTGWLCRSGYEWAQHVLIGQRSGLTDAEIEAIKVGREAESWSAADRALIQATDELHADRFISDATWASMGEHWSERQRLDLILTVGQYTQVSMLLNSCGVQLDDWLTLDPDLDAREGDAG